MADDRRHHEERRQEVRDILSDHCKTCNRMESLMKTIDGEIKFRKWFIGCVLGLIITLFYNLSVMSGMSKVLDAQTKELGRVSTIVDRNTGIIFELKGHVGK